MPLPVVIAKNQTASPILLPRLGLTVPASPATITLTEFSSFFEISWEAQLYASVTSGDIVINDGTSDLSTANALGYLDATGNMNGPTAGLLNNAVIKLDGTSGRYTRGSGVTIDASDNIATTGTISSGGNQVLTANTAAGGDLAGTYPNPTVSRSSTAFALSGVISPTALTGGTTNNYNPTGLSGASTIRQDVAVASTTITGLAGGVAGRVIVVQNISATYNLVLTSQDVNSTAANRFAMSGTLILAPNDCAIFSYDGGSSRWRLSGTGVAASAAAAGSLQAAYNGGPSITTASSVPITFTLTSGGFVVDGAGIVNIGADPTAQTLNFGTGAAAKTVTVGSSTSTSTLNLTAGSGNVNTTSAMAWTGVISPTSLAADQNNYNPTSLSTASVIRQDASASVSITGLAGGVSGRVIILYNISGANAITLVNESASSTAANRFSFPLSNVRLAPNESIILQYDGTSSRWRGSNRQSALKSRFYQFGSNASTARGDHNTVSVAANGSARFEAHIPDDFVTLVDFVAVMIPGATNAAANIDLASDYAAIGETFNVNSETDTTSTFNLTNNVMTGISLTTVATNIAAGDFFGVTITHNAIGATANYLGTLLRYY